MRECRDVFGASVARRIWHAQALLGMELAHSDAIASTRASYHLRDAANAVANPGSLDAVDACFDGRAGMLVDAQGVPRTSLTPPVILRMWTPTYRNPYFAPPVAPDAWTRPAAPGTRHLIVKFQLGSASGAMERRPRRWSLAALVWSDPMNRQRVKVRRELGIGAASARCSAELDTKRHGGGMSSPA